jgi:hypothetical protein
VSTATESALPLSRLGGDSGERGSSPRAPPTFETLDFGILLLRAGTTPLATVTSRGSVMSPPGVELVESGLLGFERPMCRGGCGNAPMLTVLRSPFPGGSAPVGPPPGGR